MIERLPPQSIEAEQAVLGAILIDQNAIVEVADIIKPEDFYRQSHGRIFQAMVSLYEEGTPTDIVTVSERIEKDGNLPDIGGRAYLSTLSNLTPSAVHAESYAEVVRQKALLRSLIQAAGQISQIAYADPTDVEEAVDRASEAIYTVSERRLRSKFRVLKGLLHEAYDKIDVLYSTRGAVTGIGSGFRDLDVLTQGFQNSDLVIVAARPSVGKTSLALNVAENVASEQGKIVGIFSLEMSEEQLVVRLLSSVAGVDSQRLRTGFLEETDFARIAHGMTKLSEAPVYIDDTPSLTVTELRTKARRMKAQVGMDLLIIDYLQLMHAPGSAKDANRVQEVSAISRGLKQLARELHVPVVALSQLSRGVESRESPEPRLSDLRESGSIEQDADVVLFLWRPKGGDDDHDSDIDGEFINLKLAKHRNGPTGDLQLWFRKSQTRFFPIDRRFE